MGIVFVVEIVLRGFLFKYKLLLDYGRILDLNKDSQALPFTAGRVEGS